MGTRYPGRGWLVGLCLLVAPLVIAPGGDAQAASPERTPVLDSASKFLSGLTREVQQHGDIRIKAADYLAMKAKGEPFTVVDVRTKEERAVVCIPKSLGIPLDTLTRHLDKIPHDQRVVVVCHSGPRAVIATSVLRMLGYDNAYALNGGIHELADVTAKTSPDPAAVAAQAKATPAVSASPAQADDISELGGDNFSCD